MGKYQTNFPGLDGVEIVYVDNFITEDVLETGVKALKLKSDGVTIGAIAERMGKKSAAVSKAMNKVRGHKRLYVKTQER